MRDFDWPVSVDEARWEIVRRVLMIGGACLLLAFITVGGLSVAMSLLYPGRG